MLQLSKVELHVFVKCRVMVSHLFVGLCLVAFIANIANCEECNSKLDNRESNICYDLYKALETALVDEKGNLYRLRRAFLYSSVVFLEVNYDITYALSENVTYEHCESGNSTSVVNITNAQEFNFGWTSSGVYKVLHPAFVSLMQLQLPFSILRLFHLLAASKTREPEVDTFSVGWLI